MRNLRDELRGIEFELSESKKAVSTCRTQSRLLANAARHHASSQPGEQKHQQQADRQQQIQQDQIAVVPDAAKPAETAESSGANSLALDNPPVKATPHVENADVNDEPPLQLDSGSSTTSKENSILAEDDGDDSEYESDDDDSYEDDCVLVEAPESESEPEPSDHETVRDDESSPVLPTEKAEAAKDLSNGPNEEAEVTPKGISDVADSAVASNSRNVEMGSQENDRSNLALAPPMELARASISEEEGNIHTISVDKHGAFSLDIWVVLLRIMGFDGAAVRRQYSNPQPLPPQGKTNLMIV